MPGKGLMALFVGESHDQRNFLEEDSGYVHAERLCGGKIRVGARDLPHQEEPWSEYPGQLQANMRARTMSLHCAVSPQSKCGHCPPPTGDKTVLLTVLWLDSG